jgi:hypothetical protein
MEFSLPREEENILMATFMASLDFKYSINFTRMKVILEMFTLVNGNLLINESKQSNTLFKSISFSFEISMWKCDLFLDLSNNNGKLDFKVFKEISMTELTMCNSDIFESFLKSLFNKERINFSELKFGNLFKQSKISKERD